MLLRRTCPSFLERFNMLFKEELVNKDHLSFTFDMAKEAVATGKAAMMINGEWVVADMMAKWPGVEIGYWNIPFMDSCDIIATGNYVGGIFCSQKGACGGKRKIPRNLVAA